VLKNHPKKILALAVLIGAAFAVFWPGFTPDLSSPPALNLEHSASYGTNTGRGNVVGIEPYMVPLDYASPARFQQKLAGYFDAAQEKGWLGDNTIVLLPEHLGTWLMATNQKSRVYSASTTTSAMLPIITGNLTAFLKNYYIFDNPDMAGASVIRAQTRQTADAILAIYSALAKKYAVTIVAGSQALMTPGVYQDSLSYGHGPIFNSSFVFGPDGRPQIDAIRKVHPIPSEIGFTQASKAEYLPVFKATNHTIGVLVCADSWFDDTTRSLASQGADLLLVPSFLEGTTWDEPWQGYVNDPPPDDGWRANIGVITEGEAWVKHALPARAKKHGIKWGMNVFLKGQLWDMKGYGHAIILENGITHVGAAREDKAALYNLWLN
jgi:Carbon-nitrogen hydrolase